MAKSERTAIEDLVSKFRVDDPKRFRLADYDPQGNLDDDAKLAA